MNKPRSSLILPDGGADRAAEPDDTDALILRSVSGDEVAFRELVRQFDPRLRYYVRKLVRDHDGADDIMQEVWIAIYRKLGGLKSPKAFTVWAYRIARNFSLKELRRQTRHATVEFIDDESHEAPAERADDDGEERIEVLNKALEMLKPAFREILTLRYLEEMSYEDISRVTGLSDGTVKSRLHYARQALQREVKKL